MTDSPAPGTRREIAGVTRVYYDGYWVRTYPVPVDTLAQKKLLIDATTRRLFNHTEYGLDVPGRRLDEAKAAYEAETDPARKRVKGAMYAGSMFNRAADIFRQLVDLQRVGVEISPSNELMRECGRCLQSAYGLARLVLHRSGEEGIDELWGEPFRAFSVPLEEFYETRYIKIAQSMREIDQICAALASCVGSCGLFSGLSARLDAFAAAARVKVETLRTDGDLFDVWTNFVTAGEHLVALSPNVRSDADIRTVRAADAAVRLLAGGRELVTYIARARAAMPKTTAAFIARCEEFAAGADALAAASAAAVIA